MHIARGTRLRGYEVTGELGAGGMGEVYRARDGYLLFVRETTAPGVWAVRFSPDTLETTGDPFLVVLGGGWPSVGADGTLAVVRETERPSQLVWLDRGGAMSFIGLLPGQLPWRGLRWAVLGMSPDRQRVAVAVRQGPSLVDVWSYDLARGGTTRLSTGTGGAVEPTAAGLQPSAPRQLFAIADPLMAEHFGVSADAQRFLFLRSGGSERVSVLLNWAAQVPDLERGRR